MNKWRVLFLIVFTLSLLLHVVFFHRYFGLKQVTTISIPSLSKAPDFLDPGISLHDSDAIINFLPLRHDLHEYLDGFGETFGMYFEYLTTGTSIGVNSTSDFPAASLFKLPVVMTYFLEKEKGSIENTTVSITKDQINDGFGDLWKRGAGTQISLDDAARIALTDSDNTAIQVLASHIDTEDIKNVYSVLDLPYHEDVNTTIITARGYSSVLKSLYFASVLNQDDSGKLIEILMETKFHDKLPAGVPQTVKVAHKIGVYNEKLYSDCGIIYVPRRPYILCMVSASSEDAARTRMKDVSSMIYRFVSDYKLSSQQP